MIRACTREDEQIWTELNREFMAYEYADDNVWENPLQKGDPREIFREIVEDPRSPNRLFLIEEEDEIIGFMNTAYFQSVWAHGKVLFLDDYFIRESFRGRGCGRRALQDLEELLREEGYKRIQLLAEDTNPGAAAFYEKRAYLPQRISFFCKYL